MQIYQSMPTEPVVGSKIRQNHLHDKVNPLFNESTKNIHKINIASCINTFGAEVDA